jgi:glycerol uptake facilitator-like aquaporin
VESYSLTRRLAAEALGTAFLVGAVVGSGVMADTLTDDEALALLCNAISTGAILIVIITILGPISGAHFNPAVTLAMRLRRNITSNEAVAYAAVQIAGGILGAWAAHLMFELPLLQVSTTPRTGAGQWFAEMLAAFGLIGTIFAALRFRPDAVAWLAGLYITSAYWFTASTSFANPAVAVARGLTATFSGIRPLDVPAFVIAEFIGAALAAAAFAWLLEPKQIGEASRSGSFGSTR